MPKSAPQVDPLYNPHDRELPPSRIPVRLQRAGIVIFLVLVAIAAVFLFLERWRRSTFSLALGLIWLGLIRYTCDSRILGIFAIRSRSFDTVFNFALGAGLMYLALSVDSLGS